MLASWWNVCCRFYVNFNTWRKLSRLASPVTLSSSSLKALGMWRLFVICLPSHIRTLWSPLATELTQWRRLFYQHMLFCIISRHVHQGQLCCVGPVCEWLGDKYVLMTSITRKHSTGNTNTTIKMSTIILLTRQEVYYSAAANHAWKSIACMYATFNM